MKFTAGEQLVLIVLGMGLLFLMPVIFVWPTLIAGTKTPAVVKEVRAPVRQSQALYIATDSPGTVSREYWISVDRGDVYHVGSRVNVVASGGTAYLDRGLEAWLEPLFPFLFYLMLVVIGVANWGKQRPGKPAPQR